MQSIIVISKNSETATQKIEEICQKEEISSVDKNIYYFEKTAGIKDILTIQEKLFLKPLQGKSKAIVIDSVEGFTPQAQNALLKILEEPPENTFIIIFTSDKNDILPTVLSRCQIIEIENKIDYSEEDLKIALEIFNNFSIIGVGEKLKLAQDISKSKEEIFPFLEKMIIICREKLLKNPKDKKTLEMTNKLGQTYDILRRTNATPRLILENLFLSL